MRAAKSVFFAFVIISLLPLCAASCKRHDASEIVLDNSDPLALAPDVSWAVVVEPYAAFREEISWDAEATDYCKQGELFPILASALASEENGGETWYRFDEGWLPASAITVYPNKLRALKAAASLGGKR
ncbi:MAG: hypothetical protein J5700_00720 [Treponema sp.]|nr:hypothetical protein [Treponema sp.]